MKSFYLFLLLVCFSFPSFSQINQPYGLFFIQDNQLTEGQQIFEAPTLKTDVSVKVQGLISTTTVRQYFINPTKEHTEAIYLFPLPDKAGVDHLRMKIGERFINGVIQKKEEAEETYQQV
ncbi:VIT domain-containing protein [uncultured Salinisphaera sp.]|uniref:VIT domain-containing protein n=1 Tax=uncultured Salinisphaera sp. TaxID=359372 RepID=UPI0032B274F1